MVKYLIPIGAFLIWLFYGIGVSCIKNKKIDLSVLKSKNIYLEGIVLSALIGGLVYYEEFAIKLVFDCVITFFIFIVAVIDIRERVVPNKVAVLLGIVSIASLFTVNRDNLINVGIAFLVTAIILFLLSKFTNEALGYGDSILLSILALYYGVEGILSIIFLSSLFVAIIGSVYMFKNFGNRKKEMPFVPFILIACTMVNIMI